MTTHSCDLAVIGGGASGLMAAFAASDVLRRGESIVVLERMNRVGKKLMATGNGRCNLTNVQAREQDYHGGTALMRTAMALYPPEAVLRTFERIGVVCRVEEDGKAYPLSNQASSVLDALRMSLEERGVRTETDCEICSLAPRGKRYLLTARDGRAYLARRVVLCAGGLTAPNLGGTELGYRLLEPYGHRRGPCLPAIVQLKTPVEPIRALKGIKFTGWVSILINGEVKRREYGEVLFTEYGVSGPPILQLSRAASEALARRRPPAVELELSVLCDFSRAELKQMLQARARSFPTRPLENFLTGFVNKRLGQTLMKLAGIVPFSRPSSSLTPSDVAALCELLVAWRLPVVGTQDFQQAQVTAGGLHTADFDPETLCSRLLPHVYAAGEVLDIDGDCGGYNLQWAWASGLLCGTRAAQSLMQEEDRP